MVMGPTCGLVLADLGAEVIKVEPIGHGHEGDSTRKLLGSGAGFYPLFNRNKKSLALDLKTPEGKEAVLRLIATADIVSENFKPGTMKKLGLDYETLKKINPRLIYVSLKGFLPGPYDHRTALDEVVITNTIPLNDTARACGKIRQLSVAPLIAETIQRIATGESVMSLFSDQENLF